MPIGVSLDLHANVTDRMVELADVMISYRTCPHVDQYESVAEVAEMIRRTMAGDIQPRSVVARGAMLDTADPGRGLSAFLLTPSWKRLRLYVETFP